MSFKPGAWFTIGHWVVRIMQKEPKDKDSEFESHIFWVFLHNLNDPNDLIVNQALLLLSIKNLDVNLPFNLHFKV